MEWNGKWNGTEISVRNMEDARMEWNGRFQEWNGRQSSIFPYQFQTRFRALYLQKNIYGGRVVINNIVAEVFHFSIYAYLSTNRGTLVVLVAYAVTHCILVSTLQFAALIVWLMILTGLTCFIFFISRLTICQVVLFLSSIPKKIRICYFITVSA